MLYNIILISVGLVFSLLLFFRFPMLMSSTNITKQYKVSIIIPARNEEKNIALLLQDLKNQIYPIHEIICVDDCSLDDTAKVATKYGVNLIKISDKPKDWTGKAWACQKGAENASGDILLFLDADVRISSKGISSLMQTYEENKCVVSVQPYHQVMQGYEQFSIFFNLIQIAANGMTMFVKCKSPGLYGPVILISKEKYNIIEGHSSARNSIVDDLALREKLSKSGFPFKLFLGGDCFSFRMYSKGIKELMQGWTKNYATGALKTPMLVFMMVFLWVSSCALVFISLIQSILMHNLLYVSICLFLYFLWVIELLRISRSIGNFKIYAILIFPLYLVMFILIFILSFVKKMFHMNVVWKDRKIKLEKL